MQRKQQQDPAEEPAVTFEIEEAPQPNRRERLGAAGAAAVTGAGLLAGGGSPDASESLDVFDNPEGEAANPEGDIPVTSFTDLGTSLPDPEFPPIDFDAPAGEVQDSAAFASDVFHGATGDVGGGFTLDAAASDEALAAPDPDIEPVDGLGRELFDDDLDEDLDFDDPDLT